MSRTVDQALRDDLLERILDYVCLHGISDLQLRPLAKAVGSSPRGLLYHFKSKEELVVAALARAGDRQRAVFEDLPRSAESYGETVRAAWAIVSAPKNVGLFRLFFEVYGLALQDPKRFPGFLERAIESWLAYSERAPLRDGYTPRDARAIATIMLGGFRGFLLDLCATGERKRLARALDLFVLALDAIPSAKELARGS